MTAQSPEMNAGKMHKDEFVTDVSLVRCLLASQFTQWAGLPIKPVPSAGTDNALYRLGDEMVVRLPRIHWAVGQVDKDHKWLPRLAPHLPLAVPTLLKTGKPAEGYPWHWAVYRWLEGENAVIDNIVNPVQAVIDLAGFIRALQKIDPTDGPLASKHNSRGNPLITRDGNTREAIASLDAMFDANLLTTIWDSALHVSDWDKEPVWFHGDLLPGNLLFAQGRLTAVIDFSGLGVGDPACDLMIAWNLFSGEGRDAFRKALEVDDATWARGRGHALSQALIFIPYYLHTNPVGIATAKRAVHEVIADYSANG